MALYIYIHRQTREKSDLCNNIYIRDRYFYFSDSTYIYTFSACPRRQTYIYIYICTYRYRRYYYCTDFPFARINTRTRVVCPPLRPTRHYHRHRTTVTEYISRSVYIMAVFRLSVCSTTTCVSAPVKHCITAIYFIIRETQHETPDRRKIT